MEIQVIAGDIGVYGHAEIDMVNAVQREGVGRHLDDGVDTEVVFHQEQQALHIERVGGSAFGLEDFLPGIIHTGGDEPGLLAAGFEDVLDHVAGGGLTVGSGHTAALELQSGETVKAGRDGCHGLTDVIDVHVVGDLITTAPFAHDGDSAT